MKFLKIYINTFLIYFFRRKNYYTGEVLKKSLSLRSFREKQVYKFVNFSKRSISLNLLMLSTIPGQFYQRFINSAETIGNRQIRQYHESNLFFQDLFSFPFFPFFSFLFGGRTRGDNSRRENARFEGGEREEAYQRNAILVSEEPFVEKRRKSAGVREKGIERSGARSVDEWVGNARNGIPRSQLRSHPDLTRPYSGPIVIAFCLFARRSLPLFTAALITFFLLRPRKTGPLRIAP